MREGRADHERQAARRTSRRFPVPGDAPDREQNFQVQRSAGNAALVEHLRRLNKGERFGGSILGLATIPALQRQATRAPPKPPPKPRIATFTEGKEADAILLASPFLKGYVEPKMKGGTTVGKAIKIHQDPVFKKKWVAYALTRDNPKKKPPRPYTLEEAKAKAISVSAFAIPEKNEVHVNAGRAGAKTWLHESLHLFSDPAGWIDVVGYNVNEGVTEYFTKLVCDERGDIIFFSEYPKELRASVDKLAGVSRPEKLADAYFNGRLEGVKNAVEAKGAGKWAEWLRCMKNDNFNKADELLK
jgi:hypothetical protein